LTLYVVLPDKVASVAASAPRRLRSRRRARRPPDARESWWRQPRLRGPATTSLWPDVGRRVPEANTP